MYSQGEIPPAVGGLTVYVVLSVADFRGDGWHGRRCHWRTDTDLAGDCISDPEDLLPSKEANFESKQWAAAFEDRSPFFALKPSTATPAGMIATCRDSAED